MAGAEISIFIQYLETERKYASHTLVAYTRDLQEFFAYTGAEYQISDPNQISHHIIRSWLALLMQGGAEPTTIRRKLSTLKSFYKFRQKTGTSAKNPAKSVTGPKLKKRLPVALDNSETEILLRALETNFDDSFEGRRDALLIRILYGCGLRRNEVITLKQKDVDPGDCTLKVLGKRNKERIIPVPESIMDEAEKYMSSFSDILNNSVNLFVTKQGGQLDPKFVYNLVNGFLQGVTSQKKKSPHVLRHSYATHLLDEGADINAIKELLGHSSLAATQVYTGNSIARLKEIYRNSHPKSKES